MENYIFHVGNLNVTLAQVAETTIPRSFYRSTAASDASPALCRLLSEAIQPAGIYRVEHKAEHSGCKRDYTSLIILMADCDSRPLAGHEPVLQLAKLGQARVECFIHRLHTVKNWMRNGHPFYNRYLVNENLVSGSGEDLFRDCRPGLSPERRAEYAKTVSGYLLKAACFHQSAMLLQQQTPEGSALSVFMLHQVVELSLRGILEGLNGYCKKTHELRQLRSLCFRCAPALAEVFPDDTEAERRLLDLLEDAYSGARYDRLYAVAPGQLQILNARVGHFMQLAQQLFQREFDII
jgi:hypothetical protein